MMTIVGAHTPMKFATLHRPLSISRSEAAMEPIARRTHAGGGTAAVADSNIAVVVPSSCCPRGALIASRIGG
jgi:hypothetical protein